MRIIFSMAIALLAFMGAANAADMPVKARPAPIAPAPSWTGWYIGINGGGVWGTTDPSATDNRLTDGFFAQGNISTVEAGASHNFNNSGGTVGGQIGYLYQAGPAILGVEAGFNWMGLKGSSTNSALYPLNAPNGFTWNLEGKSDFLMTFLARVGYDMGAWYPYVTGGLAVAHLKYTANFIDTYYPTNNTFSFNEYKPGYAIGGGAEWRIAPHWLLRGEYLYMNFDSIDGTGTIACTPPGSNNPCSVGNRTTFNFSAKFKENLGRLAVSYQW
jgi:outer membrane immunogenic protein